MMKNGKRYLLVAIALLLATVMFSGLAMADGEEAVKLITKITPEKTAYEVELKETAQKTQDVTFTVEPADAYRNIDVTSSDEDIAKAVWQNYNTIRVTSKKPGKVTITVQALDEDNKAIKDVKATFDVDFKEVDAKKIVFDKYSAKVEIDDSGFMTSGYYYGGWWVEGVFEYAAVMPAEATYHDVTWTSSDPSILVVNEDGQYKARKLGKVTVTATTTGAKKITQTAEVEVIEKPITAISFSPAAFELKPGESLNFQTYMKTEPKIDDDEWIYYFDRMEIISSDPEIYDPSAGEAGTKEGTATVTVTILNRDGTKATGSFTVTVKSVALKAISFVKSTLALNERNEDKIDLWKYLKTDPLDADVRWDEDFVWESSNPQVVSVGYDGSLSIYGIGSATISVYYKDNTAIEASIEVTVSNLAVNNVRFDRKALTLYFVAKPESKQDVITEQDVYFSVEPLDAFVKYVSGETSNAKVAVAEKTVYDGYGTGMVHIKAVGKGKCKITVYVNDGKTNYTAQLKVTVTDKGPSAKLNYKTLTLKVGKKATLVAKDTNKLKLSGKWSSSDKTIAKVNKKGVVKGVNPGRCVITFTPKSKSIRPISCQVKVVKPAN